VSPAPVVCIGLAPHSGWAAAIGLTAGEAPLRVLARDRIDMTDSRDPDSKQPYHAIEGLPIQEAEARLRSFVASAEAMAHDGLQRIVDELTMGGWRVVGVGILESSGRKAGSLADTLASHALIHTADGNHFRDALEAAAGRRGLPVTRVRSRDLEAEAAAALGKPVEALRQALKELGRAVGSPWGADQKAAALLAWLVLATRGRASP
jgi:hypothetical protein